MKTTRFMICLLILLYSICLAEIKQAAAMIDEAWEKEYRTKEFEDLYFDIIINTEPPESPVFMVQSKAAQALHVFMIFDMEVQCGGIETFFWNCGSAYAARVPEALIELGLEDVERLYSDFLKDNGITMEEIDGYRLEYPDSFGIHEAHPFEEFGEAYMTIWDETNLNRRVLDYANEYPEARMGQ